jgi:acyl carrier protein
MEKRCYNPALKIGVGLDQMNEEKIYPKVREIIADVLVIDENEITLTSRLIADLGAESIDFLDLVFQLEKAFKIKIPRGQLEKNARGALSQEAFEKGGVITEEGMVALKKYLCEVPETYFKSQMKLNDIPALFTVETFCKLVSNALTQETAEANA